MHFYLQVNVYAYIKRHKPIFFYIQASNQILGKVIKILK